MSIDFRKVNEKFQKPLLLALVLLLVAILMAPSNPVGSLPGQDNGVFLYAGQQVLNGKTPYLDFWDHKGPLVYFINALGLSIAKGSRWGVWLIEFLFLLLAGIGIHSIARAQWNGRAGFTALLFWFIATQRVGPYQYFKDSNYTETYAVLFSVFAIVFWLRSQKQNPLLYCFLVGVTAGMGFALRPNNVAVHIAILGAEIIAGFWGGDVRAAIRRAGMLLAGWGFVGLVLLGWFYAHGAFHALVDSLIVYNLVYSRKNASLDNNLSVVLFGFRTFLWLPLLAFLVAVARYVRGLWIAGFRFSRHALFPAFLILASLLEFLFSSISGRALTHYYIMWTSVIPLLGAAAIFVFFHPPPAPVKKRRVNDIAVNSTLTIAFGVVLLLNLPSARTYFDAYDYILENRRLEPERALIGYVRSVTAPDDTVLVWGNDVWINFLSGRRAPTKYAYQYALFMPGYTSPVKIDGFLRDLSRCPPALIVEPIVNTDEILPLNEERRRSANSTLPIPAGMENVFAHIAGNYELVRDFNGVYVYAPNGNEHENRDCP